MLGRGSSSSGKNGQLITLVINQGHQYSVTYVLYFRWFETWFLGKIFRAVLHQIWMICPMWFYWWSWWCPAAVGPKIWARSSGSCCFKYCYWFHGWWLLFCYKGGFGGYLPMCCLWYRSGCATMKRRFKCCFSWLFENKRFFSLKKVIFMRAFFELGKINF